jgi:hypothetical protein
MALIKALRALQSKHICNSVKNHQKKYCYIKAVPVHYKFSFTFHFDPDIHIISLVIIACLQHIYSIQLHSNCYQILILLKCVYVCI